MCEPPFKRNNSLEGNFWTNYIECSVNYELLGNCYLGDDVKKLKSQMHKVSWGGLVLHAAQQQVHHPF